MQRLPYGISAPLARTHQYVPDQHAVRSRGPTPDSSKASTSKSASAIRDRAAEHRIRSSLPFPDLSVLSGPNIQEYLLYELKRFNQSRRILYMKEFRQHPDAKEIYAAVSKELRGLGFKRLSYEEYRYEGNSPAEALHRFLKIRPLILDCATALHLLALKTLWKALGDNGFNAYIKNICDGVLTIDKQSSPIPYEYIDCDVEQEDARPSANLQHGDRLWIQGPVNGFLYHPDSGVNAYNVLADMSEPGRPLLVGFVSTASPTHGIWSYEDLRQLLLNAYNAPLTLDDFATLRKRAELTPYEYAPHSTQTCLEAFRWLEQDQYAAFVQAKQELDRGAGGNQLTQLTPPPASAIEGVRQHMRVLESFTRIE